MYDNITLVEAEAELIVWVEAYTEVQERKQAFLASGHASRQSLKLRLLENEIDKILGKIHMLNKLIYKMM